MRPPLDETPDRLGGLMRRVALRDRDAFAALYAATSAKLYGIVVRILKRRDLAEEILQDAYLKVWAVAGDYAAANGSPIAWMAAIARNRAIDEIRRTTPASLEDMPETLEIASAAPDALATLASKEDLQRLMNCMDMLEQERREMMLLAYFHGMGRDALAARFGRPVATIKTWLHRGTAQLRDCVAQ